ncbi:MAG: serine/threonine protein kinase, partial [Burkholderia gladioli]
MTITLADNPNRLTDREAMGLPETFVARTPAALLAGHEDLLGAGAPCLVEIVEDPAQPFARRHAAGALLGLLGDPRIRPLEP